MLRQDAPLRRGPTYNSESRPFRLRTCLISRASSGVACWKTRASIGTHVSPPCGSDQPRRERQLTCHSPADPRLPPSTGQPEITPCLGDAVPWPLRPSGLGMFVVPVLRVLSKDGPVPVPAALRPQRRLFDLSVGEARASSTAQSSSVPCASVFISACRG